jgi:hypothetical protein
MHLKAPKIDMLQLGPGVAVLDDHAQRGRAANSHV